MNQNVKAIAERVVEFPGEEVIPTDVLKEGERAHSKLLGGFHFSSVPSWILSMIGIPMVGAMAYTGFSYWRKKLGKGPDLEVPDGISIESYSEALSRLIREVNPRTLYTVTYHHIPGRPFFECCQLLSEVANKADPRITFIFPLNGIELRASRGTTFDQIVNSYRKERQVKDRAYYNSPQGKAQRVNEEVMRRARALQTHALELKFMALKGTPHRPEAELIKTIKEGAGKLNWLSFAMRNLSHPDEIGILASYVYRKYPGTALEDLDYWRDKNAIRDGALPAWSSALKKLKVVASAHRGMVETMVIKMCPTLGDAAHQHHLPEIVSFVFEGSKILEALQSPDQFRRIVKYRVSKFLLLNMREMSTVEIEAKAKMKQELSKDDRGGFEKAFQEAFLRMREKGEGKEK